MWHIWETHTFYFSLGCKIKYLGYLTESHELGFTFERQVSGEIRECFISLFIDFGVSLVFSRFRSHSWDVFFRFVFFLWMYHSSSDTAVYLFTWYLLYMTNERIGDRSVISRSAFRWNDAGIFFSSLCRYRFARSYRTGTWYHVCHREEGGTHFGVPEFRMLALSAAARAVCR